MSAKVFPVILSGGSGSRLWPLSRESFPKQLLPLTSELTLLQEAALRASDASRFEPITVIANVEHRFVIAEQLRDIGVRPPTIMLEPVGRNTAAAVAVAASWAASQDPDALILVMPADHFVLDTKAFLKAVDVAADAARLGDLVLFGIEPESPATGYGYIKAGAEIAGAGRRSVDAFVEKPDRATAEAYVASGDYLWNSGIFLLPAASVLAELEQHEPDILAHAQQAVSRASQDLDFVRLDSEAFRQCPSTSIDYAVLERTTRAVVVPASFGWTDVGSWSALWNLGDKDENENVLRGDVQALGSARSYIRSEGPLVATVGVEDLVIVATADAVLVASKAHDQDVKGIVERLRAANHGAAALARRVHRPWGWYEGLHEGDRFQVKRITVKPGEKLSLQKHFHRAEHWVVVNGTAHATVNGVEHLLGENESIYIPLGSTHRLANPGKLPLNLIEVQSGAYLGEDDILRLEDAYARS